MSQIIVEQQSHYTAKMTSNKHFLKVIHGNRDAKLEKFYLWRAAKLASLAKCSRWRNFH